MEKGPQQLSHTFLHCPGNWIAHVPDINDFIKGIENLLSANGIVSLEFPSLHNVLSENLFDTIYHEHYSYYSLLTVDKIFEKHNLKIIEVEAHRRRIFL